MISIVIPCYNECLTIPAIYKEIKRYADMIDKFEILFIDDGSNDTTLQVIKELRLKDESVHYISFSRNFGKEAAMLAGLEASKGEYVAVIDADLQDPPSLLPKMYEIICNLDFSYECVAARRVSRKGEPKIRSCFSRLFYIIINKLTSIEIPDGARDFRLMSRKMVNAIISDREYNRFSKGLYAWVGFNTYWLEYENIERKSGNTKWSFWGLLKYSIEGILAYSTIPLSLSSVLGIIMCAFSFLALLFVIIRAMLYGDPVAGWPSTVSIIIFIGGVVLLNLGIIGLYLSKIYLETKQRPIYIIKEQD